MSSIFPLYASYAQVAVFLSAMEQPFNDWTDQHVAQGFSWRKGSVSFAVPDGGDCLVEILSSGEESVYSTEIIREIWVPFEVTMPELVCASISDEMSFQISPGLYQLKFQMMSDIIYEDRRHDYNLKFIFSQSAQPIFSIVKADPGMSMSGDLLLDAEPAR